MIAKGNFVIDMGNFKSNKRDFMTDTTVSGNHRASSGASFYSEQRDHGFSACLKLIFEDFSSQAKIN